jgi:TatD DNase family protein
VITPKAWPVSMAWRARYALELADRLELPLVIHNREADELTLGLLRSWPERPNGSRLAGVMHCFSSDQAMMEASLALNFAISFAGPVTFRSAAALREVARQVPADRLVIETDCPYLTPQPHRGRRNEPAYLEHTAQRLAETRGESLAAFAQQTTATAVRLFGLPSPNTLGVVTP